MHTCIRMYPLEKKDWVRGPSGSYFSMQGSVCKICPCTACFMGVWANVISAWCKRGLTLADRACPEARSHSGSLCKVIPHSDCSPSSRSGLADVHELNDPRGKSSSSSQDHYTPTALSVYTRAVWPVLKSLIPNSFNITLILLFSPI